MSHRKNRFFRGRAIRTFAAVLAVFTSVPRRGSAQAVPPLRLTLGDAITMAERQGFDALLAEQAVRSAETDLSAARRLSNPLFSGVYTRSTGVVLPNGDTTAAHGYALTVGDQSVVEGLLSGKRDLRVRQAQTALEAAGSNREDALRLLRLFVAQGFYAVLSAEAIERVGREVAESFSQAAELVRTRHRYGAVSEVDLVRIEAASLEAQQTVTNATAQVAQARAALAVLLSLEDPSGIELVGTLEAEAPAWLATSRIENLLTDAIASRPDVAAARALLERTEAMLSLARRQRLPDVSLSGGYAREGPDAAPITPPSVSVGASFELPIFHLRRAEIARAESDRVSARISLERSIARSKSEVLSAWASFRAASELVSRMRGGLLERARRSRELVEYQYRSGAVSLIDLLDAERTALAVELEYRQDLGQLQTSIAQLATALGRRVTS